MNIEQALKKIKTFKSNDKRLLSFYVEGNESDFSWWVNYDWNGDQDADGSCLYEDVFFILNFLSGNECSETFSSIKKENFNPSGEHIQNLLDLIDGI